MTTPLIMQPSFEGFDSNYGSACHQRSQSAVPVCVVTTLEGHILFRNFESERTAWVVRKARVNVTRMWTASTAYFVCSVNSTDLAAAYPSLPIIPGQEKAQLPNFYIGDSICIYMGYIDSLRPVTYKDILENRILRVFTGLVESVSTNGSNRGGTNLTVQCRDRMKWLMESVVTYNTAEDVPLVGGADGDGVYAGERSRIIINLAKRAVGEITGKDDAAPVCKEPVCGQKIDENASTIYDAQTLQSGNLATSSSNTTDSGVGGSVLPPDAFYVSRTDYSWKTTYTLDPKKLEDLVVSGATLPEGLQEINRDSEGNYTVTVDEKTSHYNDQLGEEELKKQSTRFPSLVDPKASKKISNASFSSNNSSSIEGSVVNKAIPKKYPGFNIITGRLGYDSESVFAQNFAIVEKMPIEYIKILASQEIYPTEVFQDHRTGDFYYTPRVNDISGLSDSQRFYRTYYYRSYPEGVKPHPCQMLLTIREERSNISFASNVIVQNVRTGTNDSGSHIVVNLKVVPWWLADDSPRGHKDFACRYYIVTDPSLRSVTDAAIIALKFARIYSKEVRAASVSMLGDPSLCPGEVIQIVGSPLSQHLNAEGYLDYDAYLQDRSNLIKYNLEVYNAAYNYFVNKQASEGFSGDKKNATSNVAADFTDSSNPTDEFKVIVDNLGGQTSGAVLCQTKDTEDLSGSSRNTVKFEKEPQSMYRIGSVLHRFNDGQEGYFTELYLISPY